ncbi:acyltransferase [Olsenella massiliensis]|uniref:acyltransferase n=1 Tax=Olsenella massiliensis TaxID=1622075 RepID=UPI00071E5C6F|nr:acyltransferase [Olsenella massiliensis]
MLATQRTGDPPFGGRRERAARASGTIWYLQWLRALGALAIVLLHAYVALSLEPTLSGLAPSLLRCEELASIPLTRWAVPCFLMMSGALMLDADRPMPPGKLLSHVWRVVFVLMTFGLLFCLMEATWEAGGLDADVVRAALVNLLSGRSWDHLWYLYATLGLYLVTPALRAIARHQTTVGLSLLTGVLWLACCGPATLGLMGVDVPVAASLARLVGWAFPLPYYLAGHVLHRLGDEGAFGDEARGAPAGGAWAALLCLGLGALVLVEWLAATLGLGALCLPEHLAILPFGALVFVGARRVVGAPTSVPSWVRIVADHSFGIYVIHPLFSHLLLLSRAVVELVATAGVGGVILLQLVIVAAGVGGSIAVTRLCRRLPGFAGTL